MYAGRNVPDSLAVEPDEAGLPEADDYDLYRTIPPGYGRVPLPDRPNSLRHGSCADYNECNFNAVYLGHPLQRHADSSSHCP
ncbi:hypothetical protein D3C81_2169510 [compost metagenome]